MFAALTDAWRIRWAYGLFLFHQRVRDANVGLGSDGYLRTGGFVREGVV
jgi:hypothetical protein